MWPKIIGVVAGSLALLYGSAFVLGHGCCSGTPVTVFNDLDFQVAYSRCETKDALVDPKFIGPGERKTIRPGTACPITGPARKTGLLSGGLDEGRYLGCLLVPKD